MPYKDRGNRVGYCRRSSNIPQFKESRTKSLRINWNEIDVHSQTERRHEDRNVESQTSIIQVHWKSWDHHLCSNSRVGWSKRFYGQIALPCTKRNSRVPSILSENSATFFEIKTFRETYVLKLQCHVQVEMRPVRIVSSSSLWSESNLSGLYRRLNPSSSSTRRLLIEVSAVYFQCVSRSDVDCIFDSYCFVCTIS